MPTHRQKLVETRVTKYGRGSSDTELHQAAFPASPIHNNDYTDESLREQFVAEVQDGPIVDEGHTFNEYDPNYGEAPNLEEVETGGGGLPGTPYAPNIASPEQPNDPTSIPAAGAEATAAAKGGGGAFDGDNLASPHESTKVISRQTVRIGSLQPGTSEPGGGS